MYLTKSMGGNYHITGMDEKPTPRIGEKERRRLRVELQARMKIRKEKEARRREGYFR